MMNEVHVLLECPAKANNRKKAGLVQQYPETANTYILKQYLGHNWSGKLGARDICYARSNLWGDVSEEYLHV